VGNALLTVTSPLDIARLAPGLRAIAATRFGEDARIEDLAVMEQGHAGLTFGFEVTDQSACRLGSFVLKMAPPGVRRLGNTDVYRQAPLLRALYAAGLPVPDVPFASPDESDLGTPFIIMQRLPGHPFFVWDPSPAFDRSPDAVLPLWEQCIAALADLHRFDWQSHLAQWETPRPLANDVTRWAGLLDKSPDPAWTEAGRHVRDLLLARLPDGAPIGLVHGDYQPGNALYAAGRLTGIIDWELASIGSQLLDLGWLMMMADRANWHDEWTPIAPLTPQTVRTIYQEAMGQRFTRVAWYQAFAGFRLAAIACLNVRLHRTGRRPDAIWEKFGLVVPSMFARAAQLLREEP
jgi:aminoglycoside phosphotransferase (APT) family kinase protein